MRQYRVQNLEKCKLQFVQMSIVSHNSVLSRNRYSTKLSNIERKRCLMCMMDEKHIPKAEIIDMLSFLIADRGHRFPNARDIWESDLEFVNDYKLQMQKKVSFL